VEWLETRELLAGVVDVQIAPFALPAGVFLNLEGDGSNNNVEIKQTVNVGEYFIEGKNGTLLSVNGAGVTFVSFTVNGIVGDITVNLLNGNDTFSFVGTATGARSSVPANLVINNADGSDVNNIVDVLVNGMLNVSKVAATSGYSELNIEDSTVIRNTIVNNVSGAEGDTKTTINNSHLQGLAGQSAFVLRNGLGGDVTNVLGNSQFGSGSFPLGGNPIVHIINASGGSRTTFTGASPAAGFGSTTVYGNLRINNGFNIQGTLDEVSFNGSNVLGRVFVASDGGNSSIMVMNSTLGSQLTPGMQPISVTSGPGFDQFSMTDSNAPWGLLIDNDPLANTSLWGSQTTILRSNIGSALAFSDVGFDFMGDNGRDVVNMSATTVRGATNLNLFGGNNDVSIAANSALTRLNLESGIGNDTVLIDDSAITVAVRILLNAGEDELYIRNVNPVTGWPSPLLGNLVIDGGAGVDRTNLDALTLGALGFEVFVP
jgi:hypothetical protein